MTFRLATIGLLLTLAAASAGCDGQTPEEKFQAHIEAAADHVRDGKVNAAIIEYKNALQIDAESARARADLGQLYLSVGQGAAAVKELGRARDLGADGPEVTADLARALLLQGEAEAVVQMIPQAEDSRQLTDPQRALQGLLAQALLELNERARAEAIARSVAANGDPDALLALGRLAAERGDRSRALDLAARVLATREGDLQALWLKAVTHLQLGDERAGVAVLTEMRAQRWRPVRVDIELVRIALNRQDLEQAGQLLDTLPQGYRGHPTLRIYNAVHALAVDDIDTARLETETLLSADPQFAPALLVAGQVNLRLGNLEQARDQLQRFVSQQPGNPAGQALLKQATTRIAAAAAAETGDEFAFTGEQYASTDVLTGPETDFQAPAAPADGEAVRARVTAILEKVRAGAYDAAMADLAEMRADYPDSSLPRQIEAMVMWQRGEREAAVAQMQDILTATPGEAGAAVNLARMHRSLGQPDQALAVLRPALEAAPDNLPVRIELARAYVAKNDPAGVQRELEAALSIKPDDAGVRVALIRLHMQRGRPGDALQVLQSAPEAVQNAPAAVELKGMAQQRLGRHEAALATFEQLSEQQPGQAVGPMRMGETLLLMQRPGDAVAPLRRAEAADPDLLQARVYLARALLQSGRTDEAGELIARLAEQAPEESDVAILQGNYALQVEGDREAGIAAFERAYALEPTDQRLIDLAVVNTQLGRVGPAIAEMEKRRAEQPLSARALSILGELYLAAARYEDAADAYQELSAQAPDDPAARNNLAWALLQLDRTEAANTAVQEALDLAPEDPAILDTAGSIALARGKAAAAVGYLEQAVEQSPGRADIQLNYADALLAHGDLDRARKVLADLEGRDLGVQLTSRYEGLRAQLPANR